MSALSTPSASLKRKKDAADAPTAANGKRVRFSDGPAELSVTVRARVDTPNSSDQGLIAIRTPGVSPPSDLVYNGYEKVRRKRRKLFLHSESHPRLDYSGEEVSKRSIKGNSKQYIGVYDESTGSLELLPARSAILRTTLKKTFEKQRKEAENMESVTEHTNEAAKSFYERKTALGEAFGTKKAKKALKSAAANAVSRPADLGNGTDGSSSLPITAATEAVVQTAKDMAEMEGATKDDLKALVEAAHPRPRPKLDADKPEDVYKLSRTVGRDELDMINVTDWQKNVKDGIPVQTPSRFVSHRLLTIASDGDERKFRALKYLCDLISWTQALQSKGTDGSRMLPSKDKMEAATPHIEGRIRDKLRRKFAPNGSRLSPWDVNKIMLHVCAIAIVLDGCTTEVHDLQEDLRLTSKEIRNYYRELGCKVDTLSEDRAALVAKLRLPFSLPEVRQRRMTRR